MLEKASAEEINEIAADKTAIKTDLIMVASQIFLANDVLSSAVPAGAVPADAYCGWPVPQAPGFFLTIDVDSNARALEDDLVIALIAYGGRCWHIKC